MKALPQRIAVGSGQNQTHQHLEGFNENLNFKKIVSNKSWPAFRSVIIFIQKIIFLKNTKFRNAHLKNHLKIYLNSETITWGDFIFQIELNKRFQNRHLIWKALSKNFSISLFVKFLSRVTIFNIINYWDILCNGSF